MSEEVETKQPDAPSAPDTPATDETTPAPAPVAESAAPPASEPPPVAAADAPPESAGESPPVAASEVSPESVSEPPPVASAEPPPVEPEAAPVGEAASGATEQQTEHAAADAESSNGSKSAAVSKTKQARLAPLYRALRARRAIEGRVEKVIKGGYEIRLGRMRGFCPHSQIDVVPVADPESLVGGSLLFRVTQVRRGGDDVVVSRRLLLEEQRREEASAVRATLIEGAVTSGRVAGIAAFGAFVDLGAGVTGLVHVTELSHARTTKVDQAVQVGQPVQVKVLKIDSERSRISLSIRQATADPWSEVAQNFQVGRVYPGTARRVTDFGAFVEIAPGVEALAPASEFPPTPDGWKAAIERGKTVPWLVLSVDAAQHRISVALPGEGYDPDAPDPVRVGESLSGRVQRVEKFGVFVWLAPGRVGLMPGQLTGTPPGTDLQRHFPQAAPVEVDVLEVTEDGRRIRLAKKGFRPADSAAERPARRRPRSDASPRRAPRRDNARPAASSSGSAQLDSGFGTLLADKLKAALGPPQNGS